MATDRKSSKLVVLLTGMVSLIYAVANPVIYGAMSMRYRWAYKRVFGAACGVCSDKERSQSISFSSISKCNVFIPLFWDRAVFNSVLKVLTRLLWYYFTTLCGSSFTNEKQTQKPIVPCSHVFSRAWHRLHVFAFDWFIVFLRLL